MAIKEYEVVKVLCAHLPYFYKPSHIFPRGGWLCFLSCGWVLHMHVSSQMVLYHVVKTVGTGGSTWEPALQMQTLVLVQVYRLDQEPCLN